MRFKALLLPKTGEKADQVFCADLEQAKKWARRVLWDRHRKAVQNTGPGAGPGTQTVYNGPRVVITEVKVVPVCEVYPWDVTDADKSIEAAD